MISLIKHTLLRVWRLWFMLVAFIITAVMFIPLIISVASPRLFCTGTYMEFCHTVFKRFSVYRKRTQEHRPPPTVHDSVESFVDGRHHAQLPGRSGKIHVRWQGITGQDTSFRPHLQGIKHIGRPHFTRIPQANTAKIQTRDRTRTQHIHIPRRHDQTPHQTRDAV